MTTKTATLNGNTYSDGSSPGPENYRHLGNGGHRENFLPMLSDTVAEVEKAAKWATLTSASVDGVEFSAKAHAVGGSGVTGVTGSAREWAVRTDAAVADGEFSAKYHAGQAQGHAEAAELSAGGADLARSGAEGARDTAQSHRDTAAAFASTAQDSAQNAQDWAITEENVTVPGTSDYSAYHWAKKARAYATGMLVYQGAWDASGGSYPSTPNLGDYYKITVGGSLPGGTVGVGDSIIHNGVDWDHLDNSEAVTSVAGRSGAVVLQAADITDAGDAITRDVGTAAGTVAAGDHHHDASYLALSGGTLNGPLTLVGDNTVEQATLSAIAATLDVYASVVDCRVYIPSRHDSDGGRKLLHGCAHTSWYNEPLNTSIRGRKRGFPSVALIVATSSTLTIYDATDLDSNGVPVMWMVFPAGGEFTRSASNSFTTVAMMNGQLWTGDSATYTYLQKIDFAKDDGRTVYNAVGRYRDAEIRIADRANPFTELLTADVNYAIAHHVINDVAITVLPDAPIDPDTGLAVPTIAVATEGAVSLLTDSGAIYDSSLIPTSRVDFDDQGRLWSARVGWNERLMVSDPVREVAADGWFQYNALHLSELASPALLPGAWSGQRVVAGVHGSEAGLTLIEPNYAEPTRSMVAYMTDTVPGHWLPGDIKGSWLASVDDADLVGVNELTNGGFTDWTGDNPDNWTLGFTEDGGNYVTESGGKARFVSDGTYVGIEQEAVEVGKTYVCTYDVIDATSGSLTFHDAVSSDYHTTSGTGSGSFTFVATDATFGIKRSSGATDVTIDGVIVRLADSDVSVNGNGLATYGTITKTAVGTGNDLVGYSGFSASNYFEQPYNAGLDFGTGDFCFMGWIKEAANSSQEIIIQRGFYDAGWSGAAMEFHIKSTGEAKFIVSDDGFDTTDVITSVGVVDDGKWHHIAAVRSGSNLKLYIDGVSAASDTTITHAAGSLSNSSASLRVGNSLNAGVGPLINGSLALWRSTAYAPGADQIRTIYEQEKHHFNPGARCTLTTNVFSLAYDEVTGLLHVGSGTGRDVLSGLTVVERDTTTINIIALDVCDGYVGEGS